MGAITTRTSQRAEDAVRALNNFALNAEYPIKLDNESELANIALNMLVGAIDDCDICEYLFVGENGAWERESGAMGEPERPEWARTVITFKYDTYFEEYCVRMEEY